MLKFTEINRENPPKRGTIERIKDYKEVYKLFNDSKAIEQSSRCMDCGDPYCHTKCPLHNIIPAWLKQTANKDIELAFNIANETSPFPEILGRICPQDVLCEGDCSLNDTHEAVSIGAIEAYISETGFDMGLRPKFSKNKIDKSVAIIGSGPAGISAATYLLREGLDVHMFERAELAGGLLTYGIPGFKLEKKRIQRRIDWLCDAGMELTTNCEIGIDKKFDELKKEFDAIFIGIGSTKGKEANIEGENQDNVFLAMEFLTSIQKRDINEKKENVINVKNSNVVVIGGGDTAMDCVRTAIREGASNVKCLYRRDQKNMPGSKKEVLNSKEEGVKFVFNVSPVSINEKGVILKKTTLSSPDISGRQSVLDIEGSEYLENADVIILALGFDQELPNFIKNSNIRLDKYNGILTNDKHETSLKNIYSGGDSVRGANLAVNAASDGKEAAICIVNSLKER